MNIEMRWILSGKHGFEYDNYCLNKLIVKEKLTLSVSVKRFNACVQRRYVYE